MAEKDEQAIVKVAIIKSLIEVSGSFDKIDAGKMVEKAKELYEFVSSHTSSKTLTVAGEATSPPPSPSLPKPTERQEEILKKMLWKYAEIVDPKCMVDSELFKAEIIKRWGKYPESENSINLIMRAISVEDISVMKDMPL